MGVSKSLKRQPLCFPVGSSKIKCYVQGKIKNSQSPSDAWHWILVAINLDEEKFVKNLFAYAHYSFQMQGMDT